MADTTTTNGAPKPARKKKRSLARLRRIAQTQLQLLQLRQARRTLEDLVADPYAPPERIYYRQRGNSDKGRPNSNGVRNLAEDVGPWASDYADFGGSDTFIRARTDGGFAFVPISIPGDRRHGQNWPIYRTEPELDRIRQQARLLLAVNSFAQGLLRNLTNYTIGKGFAYKAVAKATRDKAVRASEGERKLCSMVQTVIDAFLAHNRWNAVLDPDNALIAAASRERECYRRVQRDGEAFVRFWFDEDGTTMVRFGEPECVRQPPGAQQEKGWSFGIRHKMEPFEDVESPEEYFFWWQDPASVKPDADASSVGEFVLARDVLHLKGPETDAALQRGLTLFCFDTARALERASKLQRNMSVGAGIRAATAEIWQMAGATQAQMSAWAGAEQIGTMEDPQSGRTVGFEQRPPGGIRRIPKGMEYVARPSENVTSEGATACNGDLRMGAATFAAPTYWLGDINDANYSNLETASAPPVKNGESEQEYYRAAFAAVVWKAVHWAVKCGKLPPDALTVIALQVEAPAVLHRDGLEKAQSDQILVQMGAKSPQTVAMENGLDPDIELTNNEEFRERTGGEGLPLMLPSEGLGKGAVKDQALDKEGAEADAGTAEKDQETVSEGLQEATEPERATDGRFGHTAGQHSSSGGKDSDKPVKLSQSELMAHGRKLNQAAKEKGIKLSREEFADLANGEPKALKAMSKRLGVEMPAPKGVKADAPKQPTKAAAPAAKPTAKSSDSDASGDMASHPFAGKSREEMAHELSRNNTYSVGGGGANAPVNPRNYTKDFEPSSAPSHAVVADSAKKAIGALAKQRFGGRPELPDVYAAVKEDHPGLTLDDFQRSVTRMQLDGDAQLHAFTQAPWQLPNPEHAIPFDHENKYYVSLGTKRESVGESADTDSGSVGDVSLDVPDVRQSADYDCGAAAFLAAARCLMPPGNGPDAHALAALGTNPRDGTTPHGIIDAARLCGLRVSSGDMDIQDLHGWLAKGCPVLCPIQSPDGDPDGEDGGHWIVVCGHDGARGVSVRLHDPVRGPVSMPWLEFGRRWHDVDAAGRRLEQFGIAMRKAGQ